MKYFYVGIDVSKLHLDVAMMNESFRDSNDTQSFKVVVRKIKKISEAFQTKV